jgi:hypothetical protein
LDPLKTAEGTVGAPTCYFRKSEDSTGKCIQWIDRGIVYKIVRRQVWITVSILTTGLTRVRTRAGHISLTNSATHAARYTRLTLLLILSSALVRLVLSITNGCISLLHLSILAFCLSAICRLPKSLNRCRGSTNCRLHRYTHSVSSFIQSVSHSLTSPGRFRPCQADFWPFLFV